MSPIILDRGQWVRVTITSSGLHRLRRGPLRPESIAQREMPRWTTFEADLVALLPVLRGYARKLTHDRERALDLVQEHLRESAALSPPLPRRDQSACLGADHHAPSPPRHGKEDEGRDGKRQMCAAGGIVGVGLQRCSSRTDLLCKGSPGARRTGTIGGTSQRFLADTGGRDIEGVCGSCWGP